MKFIPLMLIGVSMILTSCSESFDPERAVTLIHINDHHSHLNPSTLKIKTGTSDKMEKVEVGGFPRVVTKIKELEAKYPRHVKLHGGDALTGDLFFTLFDGKAEADLMQDVCFDAMVIGNHEFDRGDKGLRRFYEFLNMFPCPATILGANVKPEVGVSPLTPKTEWDTFKPYIVKEVAGEKIGIIGILSELKTVRSSSPDPTTKFLNEVETAQKYIDELKTQGVERIVLVTHQGYEADKLMAPQLRGVDVIIGGDSHTLLGDNMKAYGLQPAGPYPTMAQDKDGKKVCIGQVWEYSLVVGEMNVDWNKNGDIVDCQGVAHLLTSDIAKDEMSNKRLDIYKGDVEKMMKQTVAQNKDDLCLVRIPGQVRSNICDPSQTKDHGSDVSMVVIKSFWEQSKQADIALSNGGGIRIDLPKGNISTGDIYKVLPFSNTLVNLEMTGKELKTVINTAVDFAINPNGSDGGYPYAYGLRFDVDLTKPAGERAFNFDIRKKGTDKFVELKDDDQVKVATNDYIAKGKDGYDILGEVSKSGRMVNTYLDLSQAFADYVKRHKVIGKLPYEEYSTKSFKK